MNLNRIAKILENKNDLVINEVVLNQAQLKNQVLYGSRAYNYQVPTPLKKKTIDYDILSKKPKRAAQETAKILRRRLGKEVSVSKGSHRGTYRVRVDGEVVADYTQMKFIPRTHNVYGAKVKSLKSIKQSTQRLVKKKSAEYRRGKDIDTLDRIKEVERIDNIFNKL